MSAPLAPLELSALEIATLRARYKHERDRRIAERIQGVVLYAQGYPVTVLTQILFVCEQTIEHWIETFRAGGLTALCTWRYVGSASQLSAEQWVVVETELARRPYRRAREVAVFIKDKFNLPYSERGIHALLRRKGYRYIKARLVPGKSAEAAATTRQQQQDWVVEYQQRQAELGPHDRVYFVDATHPTHNVRISYMWTKKGLRQRIRSNSGRKRYNILGAYCPRDQEYIDIRGTENVNAVTLTQLIEQIRDRHPEATQIVLYLDNARYNHAKLVQEHITGTIVELHFLLSYSPNLNLIERLWRFLKDEVMDAYYKTFDEFVAAIADVLDHLERYADRLATLMTEKFEILTCA